MIAGSRSLALRLEIAAPRKRPEPAERLLAVDHVGGRFHTAHVCPRPPAIIHRGRPLQIGSGQVAGCLLQANEPHPLVLGSLHEELPRQNQASADDRADDRQHCVRDHASSPIRAVASCRHSCWPEADRLPRERTNSVLAPREHDRRSSRSPGSRKGRRVCFRPGYHVGKCRP